MSGFRRRLSFANVCSFLALVIALGTGGAYAANTIGSSDVIDESLLSRDIKNGDVKVADIGQGAVATDEIATGQVKAADIGDGEVRGPEIGNGQVQAEDLAATVKPGASGARAWGLVDRVGNVVRSKNVTAVTDPTPAADDGLYCVDPGPGIDPSTAIMIVGQDLSYSHTFANFDDITHAEWHSIPNDCPAGAMEVHTYEGDGQAGSNGPSDFGGFGLTERDLGFTFVIP